MRRFIAAAALVAASIDSGAAQEVRLKPDTTYASGSTVTLEVASVKRRDPADWTNIGLTTRPGGTVVASNFPLLGLISVAYGVQRSQVVGTPEWAVDAEKYDIVARSVEGLSGGDAMRTILRAVLVERFKLKTHRATRELPVFALLPVRPGAPGPRLKPAPVTCVAGPATLGAAQADTRPRCELQMPPGRITGAGIDMRLLASSLGTLLNRVVVDKTGFAGGFDLELEYVPQGGAQGRAVAGDGPQLVTALQEQLGLRVEADRAEVEVIVVDSIERPTEN
jgi:uncharacterized protein (TIGR03435 family)